MEEKVVEDKGGVGGKEEEGGVTAATEGLRGQMVRRTRFDRQVFEVMFERVNGVFGCRTRNVFDNQIPHSHVRTSLQTLVCRTAFDEPFDRLIIPFSMYSIPLDASGFGVISSTPIPQHLLIPSSLPTIPPSASSTSEHFKEM
ncbi:hypothetical protein SK128_002558, partial [Halocaridina rubra]